jgi:hypothetical protein
VRVHPGGGEAAEEAGLVAAAHRRQTQGPARLHRKARERSQQQHGERAVLRGAGGGAAAGGAAGGEAGGEAGLLTGPPLVQAGTSSVLFRLPQLAWACDPLDATRVWSFR